MPRTGPLVAPLTLTSARRLPLEEEHSGILLPFFSFPGPYIATLIRLTSVVLIVSRLRLSTLRLTCTAASGSGLLARSRLIGLCVDRHKWRVLPLAPLAAPALAGPRGFLLRAVTRLLRPRLISTVRRSATLSPLAASGSPLRLGFMTPLLRHRRQSSRASLGKAHRLPTCRPVSRRVDMPDIGSRSLTPARPSPQRHIAGSLFATYAGSTSCFLPTQPLSACSCPVGVALPSGNGGQFYFRRIHARRSANAPCQAHEAQEPPQTP